MVKQNKINLLPKINIRLLCVGWGGERVGARRGKLFPLTKRKYKTIYEKCKSYLIQSKDKY